MGIVKRRATDHHTAIRWLVHWPLMGVDGTARRGLGWLRPSSLLAVPNVTVHPSTVSVPTSYYSMWHYNYSCTLKGPLNSLFQWRLHRFPQYTVLLRYLAPMAGKVLFCLSLVTVFVTFVTTALLWWYDDDDDETTTTIWWWRWWWWRWRYYSPSPAPTQTPPPVTCPID